MNILMLTSVYPYNNSKDTTPTRVVQYFVQEWKRMGHTVKVFHNDHRYPHIVHALPKSIKNHLTAKLNFYIPDWNDVQPNHYFDDGIEIWKEPILKFIPHGDHTVFSLNRQVRIIQKELSHADFTPDVIVGHWMSPQIQLIYKLKDIYNCRTALVLHGRTYLDNKRFPVKKYLEKVDVLGCRSLCEAKFVKEKLNLSKLPFICYSGIPDSYVEGRDYNLSKFEDKSVIRFIYVGRLVRYKHIENVLEALASFSDIDYVFDIIGEGNEDAFLKEKARALNIENRVIFHGRMPRDEVMRFLDKAHYFVMVSKGEVFGLVYLEAMAASCIAIGSRGEGIDGIIKDSVNGFLTEPASTESLRDTLTKVLSLDISETKRIASKGFDTACKFTDKNVARWYLDEIT